MAGAGTLESRLIISAADKTGVVIDALASKIEALEKKIQQFDKIMGNAGKTGAQGFTNAGQRVDALGRAIAGVENKARGLERIAQSLRNIGSAAQGSMKLLHKMNDASLPFMAGAGAVGAKFFKAGATLQDQQFAMKSAGIPAKEIEDAQAAAFRLSGKYKTVAAPEIMELWKEARSVLTHTDEVPHFIEPLVRAKAAIDALDHTGKGSEGLGLLVRGAESIGAAQDPARFEKLLDSYVRGMQVMGKTINPESIYEFDKYAKLSGANLSDRYLMTTALSMSQEVGGSTAGNAVSQGYKRISGGLQNLHTAAREFAGLGLVDEKNLDYLKNGEVKGVKRGVKHAVAGDTLFASDPDLWTYNVLQPAMERHGITDRGEQLALVSKLFNSTTADLIGKYIVQKGSLENHAKLYGAATGLSAADGLGGVASQQLGGVATSLGNLMATAADPRMEQAAHGLERLSESIGNLTQSVKDDPSGAKGVGVLGAGLTAGGLAGYAALKAVTNPGAILPFFARGAGLAARGLGPLGMAGAAFADIASYGIHGEYKLGQIATPRNMLKGLPGVDMNEVGAQLGRGANGEIKAELTGSAEIKNTVEINFNEPLFWTKVKSMVDGAIKGLNISAGGVGSSGKSMPDPSTAAP